MPHLNDENLVKQEKLDFNISQEQYKQLTVVTGFNQLNT